MKKILEKKINIVKQINNLSSNSISTAIVEYSKTTSLEIKHLRKALFEKKITAKVIKNTLIKKALINTNNYSLTPHVNGQILMIFSDSEISEHIKIVKDFNTKNSNFKIKAVCIYGKVFIADDIQKIINLNSKETEIYNLMTYLKMPLIKLLHALTIIIQNKKGENNDN